MVAQREDLAGPGPTRRTFAALAVGAVFAPTVLRAAPAQSLTVAARSPRFAANGVAVSRDGTIFLGLPRWTGMDGTPSVARVGADGTVQPFPGGAWNAWAPGQDGREAFVQVNALHIFADDTLWVVDQGTADRKTTLPGAQKVLQFDIATGKPLRALRFGPDILPEGAQLNDLRIRGDWIFLTDSGLGGVVVHDLGTGRTLRRLSGAPPLLMAPDRPMRGQGGRVLADRDGTRPKVQSDMLEVSPDGRWFYLSTPSGPLKRIAVAALLDPGAKDVALTEAVETVAEIPTIGGTGIDTAGNVYLADGENRRITVLAPGGKRLTLIEDERLVSPDAIFIDGNRTLYVPAPQTEFLPDFSGGTSRQTPPFLTLSMPLPETLQGHRLGAAVTG